MEMVKEDIYAKSTSKSVEELWISFKDLNSTVAKRGSVFIGLKHRKQFIATRHMVKARIKQAYDSYLED